MSNYIDTVFNETREIYYSAHDLKDLSRAFYKTGNASVGDSLSCIAERLLESSDKINKTVGKGISVKYESTQQDTASMVGLALTMSTGCAV